jgi:hypothetical protein
LAGAFDASRFVHITVGLVNKSVDAITLTVDTHVDFVILTTRAIQFITVTIRSNLLESITEHQAILDDVELNGVTGGLLGSELGEGGGHGVVSFADVISIGQSEQL